MSNEKRWEYYCPDCVYCNVRNYCADGEQIHCEAAGCHNWFVAKSMSFITKEEVVDDLSEIQEIKEALNYSGDDIVGYVKTVHEVYEMTKKAVIKHMCETPISLDRVQDIVPSIVREREYQDAKYGRKPRSIDRYAAIMQLEMNEVFAALKKPDCEAEMRKEILQVVAVGIKCLEEHGVVEREEVKL